MKNHRFKASLVSDLISSRALIVATLLFVLAGLTPHVAAFYRMVLSETDGSYLSSWFLAVATQTIVLLATVNYKLITKNHSVAWYNFLAVITFLIFLFYLDVFNEKEPLKIVMKVFTAFCISFLELAFTNMFQRKTEQLEALPEPKAKRITGTINGTKVTNNGTATRKSVNVSSGKLPPELKGKILELSTNFSNRQVAEQLKVSHTTVNRVVAQANV